MDSLGNQLLTGSAFSSNEDRGLMISNLLDEIEVSAEMRVEIGEDIAQTIVKTSEEFDLIVMGASNEWALRQRLFGSLPDHVADNSSISVLMVRAKQ